MRVRSADILTVLAAAVLTRATSAEPCRHASLSSGGTSLVAETRTKVTVEAGGDEDGCEVSLRVLLVGGGGDGDAFSGNAGGSGFLELREVRECSAGNVCCVGSYEISYLRSPWWPPPFSHWMLAEMGTLEERGAPAPCQSTLEGRH